MKRIKKLASLMLAVVMVLAMGITVFAEGANSIEVAGAKEGETYKIYKMLDLSVHEKSEPESETDKYDSFSYTINETILIQQLWTMIFMFRGKREKTMRHPWKHLEKPLQSGQKTIKLVS